MRRRQVRITHSRSPSHTTISTTPNSTTNSVKTTHAERRRTQGQLPISPFSRLGLCPRLSAFIAAPLSLSSRFHLSLMVSCLCVETLSSRPLCNLQLVLKCNFWPVMSLTTQSKTRSTLILVVNTSHTGKFSAKTNSSDAPRQAVGE